jgi:heme-degrading monooxygenase HmoA
VVVDDTRAGFGPEDMFDALAQRASVCQLPVVVYRAGSGTRQWQVLDWLRDPISHSISSRAIPQSGGAAMIIRRWSAMATIDGARAYEEHFRSSVLPALGKLAGHRGAYLLRRPVDDRVEITVLSRWDSIDAVRAFAGDDPSHAVVEPQAAEALVSYDAEVTHHEVVLATEG